MVNVHRSKKSKEQHYVKIVYQGLSIGTNY